MMKKRIVLILVLAFMASSAALPQQRHKLDRSEQTMVEKKKKEQTARPKQNRANHTAKATNFSVSTSIMEFSADGGTKELQITVNKPWSIEAQPSTWCRLKRNGNVLKVEVDKNTTGQKRQTVFILESGGIQRLVDVYQSADSSDKVYRGSNIHNFWVYNSIEVNNESGMSIHLALELYDCKGKDLQVACYFRDSKRNFLMDNNGKYCSGGSTKFVVTSKNISPQSDYVGYEDFELKIPYSELHTQNLHNEYLGLYVVVWDLATNKKLLEADNLLILCYKHIIKVNGQEDFAYELFKKKGGSHYIEVETSGLDYEVIDLPSWCRVGYKSRYSFELICDKNRTKKLRSATFYVKVDSDKVKVEVNQLP